jgi:O-antigen/teichoic acid export membrane protein
VSGKTFLGRTLDSTFANVLAFVVHFFQAVLLVPLLLENWGKEKYGVWLSIFQFFSLLQVFDAGHQNYVGNEFNRYYHTDIAAAKRALGSGIVLSFGIGLVEFLGILILLSFGDIGEQVMGVPTSFGEAGAKWGIVPLVLMWFLVGNLGGLLMRILLPLGQMRQSLYTGLIIKLVSAVLLLLGGVLGWSLFNMALATSLGYLASNLAFFYYVYRQMPDYFPWWQGAHWATGWRNLGWSLVVSSSSLLEQFSTNGLILIISWFMGPSWIPIFATMRQLANTAVQVTSIVVLPLYPDLIRFHVNREPQKLEQVLIFNWVLTGCMVNLGFLVLQLVAKPLYEWWMRGQLAFDPILFNLLMLGVAIANFNRGLIVYLGGLNHIRSVSYMSIMRIVLLAVVGLLGIGKYGLWSLGWALLLAEAACSFLAIFFSREAFKSIGGHLRAWPIALAIAPIIGLGACFAVASQGLVPLMFVVLIGFVMVALPYYFLMGHVSQEVKVQITTYFGRLIRNIGKT